MAASIETQTKIRIISNALVLCGEQPLVALNDNRYGATVGSNLFETIYEAELQSNRWRFSCTKRALSRLASTPLNEWQYAYQLPTDMLLPIGIWPAKTQYEIYADRIYTNATSVELDFQFKPEINRVPAYFALMMEYAMAKDMIKSITESDSAVSVMTSKYNVQRGRAMFADAQGRPNRAVYDNPFVDVRP